MEHKLFTKINFLISIIILLIFSLFDNIFFVNNENTFLTVIFTLLFFNTIIFLSKREPNLVLKNQYIKHSYLFLIGFLIVHFQFYIDYFIGNYAWEELSNYFLDKTVFQKGVCYSGIALNCFYWGYVSNIKKDKQTPSLITLNQKKIKQVKHAIIYFCLLFQVLYFLNTDISYYVGGYGVIVRNYFSIIFELLLQIGFFSYIILNGLSKRTENLSLVKYIKSYHLIVLLLLTTYIISVLTSGDRGPIIFLGMAFIANYYFRTQRKIKFINLLMLLFISVLFMMFAAMLRQQDLSGKSLSYRISHTIEHGQTYALSSRSISPNTFELAQSVRAYHAGIYYINNLGYEYTYGLRTLYQTMSIIPGLGYAFKIITGKEEAMLNSALLITATLDQDHGMGTSCIADVYLDLGLIGVILVFILFGMFCRNCEVWAYSIEKNNIFHYVCSIILISFAVYLGRSNFTMLIRPIAFSYFTILILTSTRKQAK